MSRRQLIVSGTLIIVGGIVCWFVPLFHIRPLGGGETETGDSGGVSSQLANPAPRTETPGEGMPRKLEAYATAGTEITRLWDAFDADTSKARSQYGRQAGLGGAWYFCVRGQGEVETVEKDRVVLTIANSSRRICFELGVVVDNTVREAVGVKASEFANSQEFNAVSSELNRQVEHEVIAPNRPLLKPGVTVNFVGCAKISRESDLDPLCLIPIQLEARGVGFQPRGESFQLAIFSNSRNEGKLEAYPTGNSGKQDAYPTGTSIYPSFVTFTTFMLAFSLRESAFCRRSFAERKSTIPDNGMEALLCRRGCELLSDFQNSHLNFYLNFYFCGGSAGLSTSRSLSLNRFTTSERKSTILKAGTIGGISP